MDKKEAKKHKRKKDLIEIGIIIGIFGVLYFTGLHTDVAGFLQRGLLKTGIHNAGQPEQGTDFGQTDYRLSLRSMEGETVSLADFSEQTVFINFWATWCPPCIAEMPDIQALYQDMQAEGVQFVMISLDEDPEKARAFMERKAYDFPVYFPASQIPEEFMSNSIPTTFVVEAGGAIRYKKQGLANYNTEGFRGFLREITGQPAESRLFLPNKCSDSINLHLM